MQNITLVVFLCANILIAQTYSGGSGISGDPYQIATLADLQYLSENSGEWSKFFIQTADIDASGTSTWNADGSGGFYGFSPIGNSGIKFTGQYDGDNKTISWLTINRATTDYIGLFGRIETAGDISDLNLTSVNILGQDHTGALVGENKGTITNCSVGGTVSSPSEWIGGLVGSNNGGTIKDSDCSCTVSGENPVHSAVKYPHNVGGFVGVNYNDGVIDNSFATGDVSTSGHVDYNSSLNTVGGFCAFNSTHTSSGAGGTITNCYATGNVTADGQYAGGFIGIAYPYGEIKDCYATGNVTAATGFAGGFVAVTSAQDPSSQTSALISKCYSTGSVTTNKNSYAGGFVGRNQDGSVIEECFASGNASASRSCGNAFAGGNTSATSIIRNCYSTGNSETGRSEATGDYCASFCGYNQGVIENSFSVGTLNSLGESNRIDGFCGYSNGTISSSFYDLNVSGRNDTGDGEPKTTSVMKDPKIFVKGGWSDAIWFMDAGVNDGYPYLAWQNPGGTKIYFDPKPYMSINSGAKLDECAIFTFTNSNLKGVDPDGISNSLIYTITQAPAYGILTNGVALINADLNEISSFTQMDINDGKIQYINDGSEANEDFFKFTISDEDGNISDEEIFNLTIISVNDTPSVGDLDTIYFKEDKEYLLDVTNWYDTIEDVDNADSTLIITVTNSDANAKLSQVSENQYTVSAGENYFGVVELDVLISDGELSCSTSVQLVVEPVNDSPTVGFLKAITNQEDKEYLLDVTRWYNSIEDIDNPDSTLIITVSSSDDNVILSQVNKNNYMVSTEENYFGSVELKVLISDGELNCSTNVQFVVEPDNDPPLLSNIEPTFLQYAENEGAKSITNNILIEDIDSEKIEGATISITKNYQPEEDQLLFVSQVGIIGNWNPSNGELTLIGSGSLLAFQNALRSVQYNNLSNDPFLTQREVSFVVTDGDKQSIAATRIINLTCDNDAPHIFLVESQALVYSENEGNKKITSTLTISDEDNAEFTSASVTISEGYQQKEDQLFFTSQNGIVGTWDAAAGTLNLSGRSEKLNYKKALRSVSYSNKSENPTEAKRSISFMINDGNAKSEARVRELIVESINDAPVVNVLFSNKTANEDEEFIYEKSQFYPFISDPDNADSTLEISLTSKSGNIETASEEEGTIKLIGKENWFGHDTLIVTVSDGEFSAMSSFEINILPINDSPEILQELGKLIISSEEGVEFDLYSIIEDVETPDTSMLFQFELGTDSLIYSFDKNSGMVQIKSISGYLGEVTVKIIAKDEAGESVVLEIELEVTFISGIAGLNGIPQEFKLYQNFPNPFNPATVIRYGIPLGDATNSPQHVSLKIYDILGNLVVVLQDGLQSAAYYERTWNAGNMSSGIYFYMLNVGNDFREVKKMILLK